MKPNIWTENSEHKWISDEASYLPLSRGYVLRDGEYLSSALCPRYGSQRTVVHAGKRTDARFPAVTETWARWCFSRNALAIWHWLEHAFAKVDLGHDKRWNGHHGLRTSIHGNTSKYDRTVRSSVGCMFVNITPQRVLRIRFNRFTQSWRPRCNYATSARLNKSCNFLWWAALRLPSIQWTVFHIFFIIRRHHEKAYGLVDWVAV
jgi:hypothetical protein